MRSATTSFWHITMPSGAVHPNTGGALACFAGWLAVTWMERKADAARSASAGQFHARRTVDRQGR
jgi:hypothetical protein